MSETNTTKKTPKISEYDTFSSSPFTVSLIMRQWAPKPENKVMEDNEGKMWELKEVPKNKTIVHDNATYSKLFHGNSTILMDMPEPSMKMFYYIHDHLKPSAEVVCIPMDDYLKYAKYKETNRPTYYRAIEGLLKLTIMARMSGNPSCFYINPNIIFNGDRTKLKNITVKSFDDGGIK